MGVVRSWETRQAELESFCRKLMADTATIHRLKDLDPRRENKPFGDDYEEEEMNSLVCVTSGASYLGLALVNKLLQKGYSVRITIENPEDIEKVREIKEIREGNGKLEVIMGQLSDVESLINAFEGCHGVFHTSAFTDPAGLSGYTKSMAEIEVRASENVMEACARTTSIKRCVFTSSLLACVWQQQQQRDSPITIINHNSWTNESLCKEKKLWYALGKVRAEKAAWRIANERGLKLTTICPALVTGSDFFRSNPTSTIAYLKGAQEMYCHGLLATVDVTKLAEAHAIVFKAMKNSTASGRYICFDKLIDTQTEAENLAKEIGMPNHKICGDSSSNNNYSSLHRFMKISNDKLSRLMSGPIRCYTQQHC